MAVRFARIRLYEAVIFTGSNLRVGGQIGPNKSGSVPITR